MHHWWRGIRGTDFSSGIPRPWKRALPCGPMVDTLVRPRSLQDLRNAETSAQLQRTDTVAGLVGWALCGGNVAANSGLLRNSELIIEITRGNNNRSKPQDGGTVIACGPKLLYPWLRWRGWALRGSDVSKNGGLSKNSNIKTEICRRCNDSAQPQSGGASTARVPKSLSIWHGRSGCYRVDMPGWTYPGDSLSEEIPKLLHL